MQDTHKINIQNKLIKISRWRNLRLVFIVDNVIRISKAKPRVNDVRFLKEVINLSYNIAVNTNFSYSRD